MAGGRSPIVFGACPPDIRVRLAPVDWLGSLGGASRAVSKLSNSGRGGLTWRKPW